MFEREHVTDALRFWELARIPYNFVLFAIVLGLIACAGGDWRSWIAMAPAFFLFAVIANVFYCCAYPVDLLVQASDFRARWRGLRWILWTIGTATAGLLAAWIMLGLRFFGFD